MRQAVETETETETESEWPEVWVASFQSARTGTIREELFGSESEALSWLGTQRLAHHALYGQDFGTWLRKAELVGDGLIKYRRYEERYGGEDNLTGYYYERHPADNVKRINVRKTGRA